MKNVISLLFISILFLLLSLSPLSSGFDSLAMAEDFLLSDKEKILAFAGHLFESGEYYRAITEYSRFIFFFPDDPMVKVARLKIAYAYQKGEQWPLALQHFEAIWQDYPDREIGREAYFQSAKTLWQQQNYTQAIERYKGFIKAFPEDERSNNAYFHIGCITLELHNWTEAAKAFDEVKSTSKLFPEAINLAEETKKLSTLDLKKPALAGLFSALVPGAGQVYAQRYRDGLTAFAVNGGFIWAIAEAFHKDQNALGGILLFIESGWYAGNIYSAVNSTKKSNKRKIEKKLIPLLERCSLSFHKQPKQKDFNLSFLIYY